MNDDSCAYCGARALRDAAGHINTWAVTEDLNGAGEHEHETIAGER